MSGGVVCHMNMARGWAVTLYLWAAFCCCFLCVAASTGTRCLACTYNFAGDGLQDKKCVTDPFQFVSTRNISCDFTTHSCVINAVYDSDSYSRVQSLARYCLETSNSLSTFSCKDGSCLKYCRSDLCNDGDGDLHSTFVAGLASLGLTKALWLLATGLFLVWCLV